MIFLTFVIIFSVSLVGFVLYGSFVFQTYVHRRKLKKSCLTKFKDDVMGDFISNGYFASSHRVVTRTEYASFNQRHKISFTKCYNIVRFKTQDADWEFFFHLVREGHKFSEIMTLRVFPKKFRIKSEGNVEKSYSRLNIFTNNRYLTEILEEHEAQDYLKWLIRHNGDILLLSHNNLHFKAFISAKQFTSKRTMDMVKSMNVLKNKIFKDNVLEY